MASFSPRYLKSLWQLSKVKALTPVQRYRRNHQDKLSGQDVQDTGLKAKFF